MDKFYKKLIQIKIIAKTIDKIKHLGDMVIGICDNSGFKFKIVEEKNLNLR